MKRLILPLALFFSFIAVSISSAQTDTLIITPKKFYQCGYDMTLRNRNAAQQSIDEVRLEVISADGTQLYQPEPPQGWTIPTQEDFLKLQFFAISPLAPGATKTGFTIDLDMTTSSSFPDKPVSIKWTTLNGSNVVSTGTLILICTQFQGGAIDSVSVQPMLSGTDPCFDFTVYNKNQNNYPIERFVAQLHTPNGGTIRPSKVSAPAGWVVDSVTATQAFFSSISADINDDASLSGFKVCLRGNPAVSSFAFNWSTYEFLGVVIGLLGRDTIRNIPNQFSGSATEADSISASVVNGCLYTMTVKNFHVSNSQLPSRIRRVTLWANTPGLQFTAAPSAPTNWSRRLSALGDSVIYTANHDSASLPSSRVSSDFRFSINPPSNDPVSIGWRTFQTLTTPLSSGAFSVQCSEQPPLTDTATIGVADVCLWNLQVTNQHNQPVASDLYGIEVSIPAGSGTLSAITGIGWTKTNETATSVRFVASAGQQLQTGQNAGFSIQIDPQTPGADIVLTWKTYEEAGLQTNTALKTGTFTISCSPVVVLCDVVSAVAEGGDTCMQNFTIKSRRSVPLVGVTIEPRDGWKIGTAVPPDGWDMQLDANKTLVTFTKLTGIAPDGSQSDFRVSFNAIDQANTFNVKVTTADVSPRACDTLISFTCVSGTSGVDDIVFTPEQVTVVPNPVSHTATVELTINDQSWTTITLLDLLGRQVAEVSSRFMTAGTYKLPLEMSGLEAGTYYLRVQSAYGVVTKKVVLAN